MPSLFEELCSWINDYLQRNKLKSLEEVPESTLQYLMLKKLGAFWEPNGIYYYKEPAPVLPFGISIQKAEQGNVSYYIVQNKGKLILYYGKDWTIHKDAVQYYMIQSARNVLRGLITQFNINGFRPFEKDGQYGIVRNNMYLSEAIHLRLNYDSPEWREWRFSTNPNRALLFKTTEALFQMMEHIYKDNRLQTQEENY